MNMNTTMIVIFSVIMMAGTSFGQDKPTYFRLIDWYTKDKYCGSNLTDTIIQVCRDHFADIQQGDIIDRSRPQINDECCYGRCSPFEMRDYCDYYLQDKVKPDYTLVDQISESRYKELRRNPFYLTMTMKCPFTGLRKCLELFQSDDDKYPMYHNPYYDVNYIRRN